MVCKGFATRCGRSSHSSSELNALIRCRSVVVEGMIGYDGTTVLCTSFCVQRVEIRYAGVAVNMRSHGKMGRLAVALCSE